MCTPCIYWTKLLTKITLFSCTNLVVKYFLLNDKLYEFNWSTDFYQINLAVRSDKSNLNSNYSIFVLHTPQISVHNCKYAQLLHNPKIDYVIIELLCATFGLSAYINRCVVWDRVTQELTLWNNIVFSTKPNSQVNKPNCRNVHTSIYIIYIIIHNRI